MLNRATMHQEFVTLSDGHAAAAGQSSVILLHRPSTFSRCLNRDGQGDVIEMTELSPTALGTSPTTATSSRRSQTRRAGCTPPAVRGTPTTLGLLPPKCNALRYNALPGHQTALITSGCGIMRSLGINWP